MGRVDGKRFRAGLLGTVVLSCWPARLEGRGRFSRGWVNLVKGMAEAGAKLLLICLGARAFLISNLSKMPDWFRSI